MNFKRNFRANLLLLPLIIACFFVYKVAAETTGPETAPQPEVSSEQAHSLVATLSDQEVRRLLLEKLGSEENGDASASKPSPGLVVKASGWLHILDKDSKERSKENSVLMSIAGIAPHLGAAFKKIGNGSYGGGIQTVAILAVVFVLALLVEMAVRRFTKNFSQQFKEKAIPDLDGPMRFIAGIMRSIPSFIHIIVYLTVATLFFLLFTGGDFAPSRYLFLAILITVVFYRCLNQFSRIICSPDSPSLRVIPANNEIAVILHRSILLLCTYTFAIIMVLALLKELEFDRSSFYAFALIVATLLIAMIIYGILRSKIAVREYILKQSETHQTRNWIIEQFAEFWHVPTVLYFIIVWAIGVNELLNAIEPPQSSAFLPSLMVLPLYILFDTVGQWVVRTSVSNLQIYNPEDEKTEDEELKDRFAEAKAREKNILVTGSRIVRITIIVALLVWAASLWGYEIPYVSVVAGAIFESLITLALGLGVWRFASSYIEQKIHAVSPAEENEEDSDNEFGSAGPKERSYTLLPLLRKFIATILLVMVTLVILSAFGVDIGPLLAGAGVVGLAVGFGAQKLVSDVFSGFFYLLDDAFRVGEYIKAGSVSGTVESITLRNVMLRHHRGMLQIVPHSSLGSITNYMRGGVVIKFNLEFSYDTDINKVRKIIKKVGQAMLADEEFADDFIKPIKSQGVKEITGSVMTIRVKFTAHPGTQFVIQREAFRRISEALNSQGIYYAHRRVIVELPQDDQDMSSPEEGRKKVEAGAAAGISQMEEDEKKKQQQSDS